jgi:hypothetical protein
LIQQTGALAEVSRHEQAEAVAHRTVHEVRAGEAEGGADDMSLFHAAWNAGEQAWHDGLPVEWLYVVAGQRAKAYAQGATPRAGATSVRIRRLFPGSLLVRRQS